MRKIRVILGVVFFVCLLSFAINAQAQRSEPIDADLRITSPRGSVTVRPGEGRLITVVCEMNQPLLSKVDSCTVTLEKGDAVITRVRGERRPHSFRAEVPIPHIYVPHPSEKYQIKAVVTAKAPYRFRQGTNVASIRVTVLSSLFNADLVIVQPNSGATLRAGETVPVEVSVPEDIM